MNSSSNRFKAKNKADGQDTILNALHEQAGDDAPFAASSAALQAANSVLLASMRARMGQAAPTPSPIHASAAKQTAQSAAEHSPIVTAAPAAPQSAPTLVIAETTGETIAVKTETLPAATAPIPSFDTVSYEKLVSSLPEPQEDDTATTASDTTTVTPVISPAAQKRELGLRPEIHDETAELAPTHFGRRSYDPEPEGIEAPATATASAESPLDTQRYQAENDSTYREWQSAMQPNERQWQKLAMIGVLVVAVAVNLVFFLSSENDTPTKASVASSAKLMPIDMNRLTAAQGSKPVTIKIPAADALAVTEAPAKKSTGSQILFPDKNPPKLNDMDESYGTQKAAEPRELEISNQLSLPNQEGPVPNRMPTNIIPPEDAEAALSPSAAPAPQQHLTPPKPAAHDAPLPVPSTKKQATINPQQLLRVLSRP